MFRAASRAVGRIAGVTAAREARLFGTALVRAAAAAKPRRAIGRSAVVKAGPIQFRTYASGSQPAHINVKMPALSPTMTSGKIAEWKVKEGDQVKTDQVLAVIETDKATMDFQSTEEGYIAKILVAGGSGDDIAVNTRIAIIVEEKKDVAAFANETSTSAPAAAAAPAPAAAPAAAPAKSESKPAAPAKPKTSYPSHEVIKFPALSPSMTTGKLVSWMVKPGDKVKMDQAIASIQTDKAVLDFQLPLEGYIAKLLMKEGAEDVPVNAPIAVIVDEAGDVDKFKDFEADGAAAAPAAAPAAAAPSAAPAAAEAPRAASPARADGARVVATPYAKKVAGEKGVSLNDIAGTGPSGRIVAADVEEYAAAPRKAAPAAAAAKTAAPAAAAAGGDFTDIPHTNMRKVIAKRLTESKQTIPHYYLSAEINVSKLLAVRKQLNDRAKDGEYKLSVNDFVIKAAALALRKVPAVNASWHDTFVRQYNSADVSVAVDTGKGLITPIVFHADKRGLASISASVKELAKKAKDNKLKPEEFIGGSFSISNLGMYGVDSFSAIINPGQAAILAVGAASDKIIPADNEKGFEVAPIVTVTLSCDHRVVDGATGAQWLQAFKGFAEDPVTLLL